MTPDRDRRTVWVSGIPPDADELAVAFHFNAVAPVDEVRILRRGLLGGRLAIVVLRDEGDVERVLLRARRRLDRETPDDSRARHLARV